MNRKSGLILLLALSATFGGCASMSGEECVASDWSAIGYEDGSNGYNIDRHAKYRKACAKHGVTSDFAAYQNGRDQGLLEYCQPNRGFKVGVRGGSYNGVCAVNLEADFLDAYNAGYQLYSLRSRVNRASSSINSKENELDEIEDLQLAHGVSLVSGDLTGEDRVFIVAEMKKLAERSGKLEAEVKDLYEIRARAQVELEQYQIIVADLGY